MIAIRSPHGARPPGAGRAARRTIAFLLVAVPVFLSGELPSPRRSSGVARAADGVDEGQDLEAKIREKMNEILRLMRENGKAILDASKAGGAKPAGVEVKPPDPTSPGGPPPAGTTPPPGGGPGGGPSGGSEGGGGEAVKRRMEELLKQMGASGGTIPKELEELVRMIPTKQGSSSDGKPPPEAGSRKPGEKPNDPTTDPKKDPSETPKTDPTSEPKPKDGDKPPPDAAKDPPRDDETPPWALELPPEVRRAALNASPERIPEAYRPLLLRYQRWLQERATRSPR